MIATEAALALIESPQKHGPLMFHQSGGCCDNSAANCYLPGEITIGTGDVLSGRHRRLPGYRQGWPRNLAAHAADHRRDRRSRRHLSLGAGGKAFHFRSRVFTDAEIAALNPQPGAVPGRQSADAAQASQREDQLQFGHDVRRLYGSALAAELVRCCDHLRVGSQPFLLSAAKGAGRVLLGFSSWKSLESGIHNVARWAFSEGRGAALRSGAQGEAQKQRRNAVRTH